MGTNTTQTRRLAERTRPTRSPSLLSATTTTTATSIQSCIGWQQRGGLFQGAPACSLNLLQSNTILYICRSTAVHLSESSLVSLAAGRPNHSVYAKQRHRAPLFAQSGGLHQSRISPIISHSCRRFSNLPSEVKPVISSTSPVPPAPPPSAKGKPKVDLRPGPVKALDGAPSKIPSATHSNALVSSGSQAQAESLHSTKLPVLSTTSMSAVQKGGKEQLNPLTDATAKPEAQPSIMEVAKRDIDEAARHGILAPPPPDAGFARRLFHQAKELFVRTSQSSCLVCNANS